MLQTEFISGISEKIRDAHDIDVDSKLATYFQVNPNLQTIVFPDSLFALEIIHIRTIFLLKVVDSQLLEFLEKKMYVVIMFKHYGFSWLLHCSTKQWYTWRYVYTCVCVFNWDKLHDYLLIISNALKIEL